MSVLLVIVSIILGVGIEHSTSNPLSLRSLTPHPQPPSHPYPRIYTNQN